MRIKKSCIHPVWGVGIGVAIANVCFAGIATFPLTALAVSDNPMSNLRQHNPGRGNDITHVFSPDTAIQINQKIANNGSDNTVVAVPHALSALPETIFIGNFEQGGRQETHPLVTNLKANPPIAVAANTSRQRRSSKNDPILWLWFIGFSGFGLFILWRFMNISRGNSGLWSDDSFFSSSDPDSYSSGSDDSYSGGSDDSYSDGGDFGGGSSGGGGDGGDW